MPKGMTPPDAVNTPFILDYDENWEEGKFEKLPDFIKDKIKTAREYKQLKGIEDDQAARDASVTDSNPF
jgi:type IV secretory pathway VirB4 component